MNLLSKSKNAVGLVIFFWLGRKEKRAMVNRQMEESQWKKLLVLLKRVCGKRRPTVEQIEWVMDELAVSDDVEIDYDVVVTELSCFELDVEQEQIRRIEKKFQKMAKQAKALESIDEEPETFQVGFAENRWREENEALVARVEQITT
jgi:hypothetical protein